MATKEDILEQIVEEYLIHKGYFVQHNIKFRPREDHPDFRKREDSSYSDIDVLAYHPKLRGPKRVFAVSCKSWQKRFWSQLLDHRNKSRQEIKWQRGLEIFSGALQTKMVRSLHPSNRGRNRLQTVHTRLGGRVYQRRQIRLGKPRAFQRGYRRQSAANYHF